MLDTPADMVRLVLSYLGRDPNSDKPEDIAAVEDMLLKIRPYVRNINSSEYIEALANGDLCIAVGYNGDVLQARDRARDADKGIEIKYTVPKEGSILWFDMLAIPKDAPHPDSAYAFMNHMMDPKVVAEVSNFKRFANANLAAQPFVLDSVKNDPAIYPPPEIREKLEIQLADSAERDPRDHPALAKVQDGSIADGQLRWGGQGRAVAGPERASVRRDRTGHENVRRFQGSRRRQPQDLQGRDFLPAGRIGLRQDDAAAHARGLRDPDIRADTASTART